MAYVTADQIAAALGVTFTPEQAAQAEIFAEAATTFIDKYTGRTWQTESPVSGEVQTVIPAGPVYPGAFGVVYLSMAPVVAVTSVLLRTGYPNPPSPEPTMTVESATSFELVDPQRGVVTIAGAYVYPVHSAIVDYTHNGEVPADIMLAATMIASGQVAKTLAVQRGSAAIESQPALAGMESISVGQNDISVKLSSAVTSGSDAASGSADGSAWAAPGSAVASILDNYKVWAVA